MMIHRTSFVGALLLTSLTAFVQPAGAQFSGNIVGYVSVYFTNGLRFVANPLLYVQTNDVPNNWLTNLISTCPQGTKVYLWDIQQQAFSAPATFDAGSGWDFNFDLPPGKGFVVSSTAAWTNTFVGDVLLGTTTNFVAGANRFSLLGSKLPQEGTISSNLFFPKIDGASVYLFRVAGQQYSDAFSCFEGLGWFDPNGVAGIDGPVLQVAESFLVQNPGPDTNWIRTFQVGPSATQSDQQPSKARSLTSVSVGDGKLTLRVRASGNQRYDVQFSSDRQSWKTVARNQTGASWKEAFPRGSQGYYRLVTR